MKYSIFTLSLLVIFSVHAMQDNEQLVKTTVGQTIALTMYTRESFPHVFYHPEVCPDTSVLKFIKEFEEKKGQYTTAQREYLALKEGVTHLKFGLYSAHMAKFCGNVSYKIVVE